MKGYQVTKNCLRPDSAPLIQNELCISVAVPLIVGNNGNCEFLFYRLIRHYKKFVDELSEFLSLHRRDYTFLSTSTTSKNKYFYALTSYALNTLYRMFIPVNGSHNSFCWKPFFYKVAWIVEAVLVWKRFSFFPPDTKTSSRCICNVSRLVCNTSWERLKCKSCQLKWRCRENVTRRHDSETSLQHLNDVLATILIYFLLHLLFLYCLRLTLRKFIEALKQHWPFLLLGSLVVSGSITSYIHKR